MASQWSFRSLGESLRCAHSKHRFVIGSFFLAALAVQAGSILGHAHQRHGHPAQCPTSHFHPPMNFRTNWKVDWCLPVEGVSTPPILIMMFVYRSDAKMDLDLQCAVRNGSLSNYAKSLGWANAVNAFVSHGSTDWTTFCVSLLLTNEGTLHIDELVEMVFAYIEVLLPIKPNKHEDFPTLQMLKVHAPQEYLFREWQKVALAGFHMATGMDRFTEALSVAKRLHTLPPGVCVCPSQKK